MTVCPVAIALGCKKCPIFAICPMKSVIGDHKKTGTKQSGSAATKAKSGRRD